MTGSINPKELHHTTPIPFKVMKFFQSRISLQANPPNKWLGLNISITLILTEYLCQIISKQLQQELRFTALAPMSGRHSMVVWTQCSPISRSTDLLRWTRNSGENMLVSQTRITTPVKVWSIKAFITSQSITTVGAFFSVLRKVIAHSSISS